jgi:hypothetical protein
MVDTINAGTISVVNYQLCAVLGPPGTAAFTLTVAAGNTQYRPDSITLCPWYLNALRQRGILHLTGDLIQRALYYPGDDIDGRPVIDSLVGLDNAMLHEVIPIPFKFYFS